MGAANGAAILTKVRDMTTETTVRFTTEELKARAEAARRVANRVPDSESHQAFAVKAELALAQRESAEAYALNIEKHGVQYATALLCKGICSAMAERHGLDPRKVAEVVQADPQGATAKTFNTLLQGVIRAM